MRIAARFDTPDMVESTVGAAERSFCMTPAINFLIAIVLVAAFIGCTGNNVTHNRTNDPPSGEVSAPATGLHPPSRAGSAAKIKSKIPAVPKTQVLAVCNFERSLFTLKDCIESFEQADQTIVLNDAFYLYGVDGPLTDDTEVEITYLNRIVLLSRVQSLVRQSLPSGSWLELRVRQSPSDWSDPVRFRINLPKTQVTALCNLHRENFTREECLAAYESTDEKLNRGEKFFLYGEDGILWKDVSVIIGHSSQVLSMPEAIAKVSESSATEPQVIQVKRAGESWSDPIELNLATMIPSRPSILQACTDQMRSCTPEILEKSQAPILLDLLGIASWEQTHIWMETIVDGDTNSIACYPLWLAVQNGAEYCAMELHSPAELSAGKHELQSRLVNSMGSSEWSEIFLVEFEEGETVSTTTILGSQSTPNIEISVFSAFSSCGSTRADSTGQWTFKVTNDCAPDGTTLKIVESFEAGPDFARATTKFDTSVDLTRLKMPSEGAGEAGRDVVWTLTLLEPWSYGHLILSDLLSSLRLGEARSYFDSTLLSMVAFIETTYVRPESEQLKQLAEQHYDLLKTFWFPENDTPQNQVGTDEEQAGETAAEWLAEIDDFVAARDEILGQIYDIASELQEICVNHLAEAPDVCVEDFERRSESLKQKYQQHGHATTKPYSRN